VAVQLRYSLIDRSAERELLPMARALDLAVTPWSILGAGVLSGKYNPGAEGSAGRASAKAARVERNLQIAEAVTAVARESGVTPSQAAIAWVRQQAGVVIPLLGARNLEQLEDNLGAVGFALSPEQVQRLDELSQMEPGFPHDFLASEGMRKLMSGDTHHRQDRHR
jgi:aryl-alcohol dehydrogenase-like predicted oxidoreductase